MQFGGARWSLGGPGWSPGAARGFPGGFGEQNECFRNGVFGPPAPRGGFSRLYPALGVRKGVWGREKCCGMTIWPPSAAIKSEQRFWT